MSDAFISTQIFGNTGRDVAVVGLDGGGVLRTFGKEAAADNKVPRESNSFMNLRQMQETG